MSTALYFPPIYMRPHSGASVVAGVCIGLAVTGALVWAGRAARPPWPGLVSVAAPEPALEAPELRADAEAPEVVPDAPRGDVEAAPVDLGAPSNPDPGLAITRSGLRVTDWGAWMRHAPRAAELAMAEGGDAQTIVTNMLRRIYPQTQWPPEPGSPLAEAWPRLLAAAARSMSMTFPGSLSVVS